MEWIRQQRMLNLKGTSIVKNIEQNSIIYIQFGNFVSSSSEEQGHYLQWRRSVAPSQTPQLQSPTPAGKCMVRKICIQIVVVKSFQKKIESTAASCVNASIFFSAALGECAKDKDSLKVIQKLDGVRLLWSLLKHPSTKVCVCVVR